MKAICQSLLVVTASLGMARAQSPYYTDTGSPANPTWAQILPSLNVESNDPGPVNGSVLSVVNSLTEAGFYGDRTFSVGSRRIHVCCNSSTTNFTDFTRWYQQDGNTEVFRLFVNDENTASDRPNAARCESFTTDKWLHSDYVTYEWTGRYTIARQQQNHAIFQVKNDEDDWAVQLNLTSTGALTVNNRRNATDVTVKNPDGTDKDFDGLGFDVRIQDDGNRYKVWIDGALLADNFYDRNDVAGNETNFRWGKYMGDSKLTAPSDVSVIMVSGAQVRSWPGRLTAPVTDIEKANNTQNLQNTASWTGGVVPGIHKRALWDSSVTAANTTATLSAEQSWGGIKITNPGAQVTINGSATLGIDRYGVDMSAATRNLVVNCPVETRDTSTWNLASGRAATFSGVVSGLAGVTTAGSGTVVLTAANTYTGETEIDGGTLRLGNGGTTGELSTASVISVGTGATFEVNQSDAVAQGTEFSGAAISGAGGLRKSGTGTLTLTAANTYTGPTTVSAGTLAFSTTAPFANSSTLSLADDTLLRPGVGGVTMNLPITVGAAGTTAGISAPTNLPGSGVSSTLTLGGVISGAGNVTFTSSANQNALSTVRLNAPSIYTGSTLLDTAGTDATQIIVRLGTHNALPPATVVTIDGQTGEGTGRFAEVNLNGFNQQLAGLTNIPRTLRSQRIVNSNAAAAATLTISGSGNHTYTGSLGGAANGSVSASAMPGSTSGNNFALTKNGAGTFIVAGTHSYFGNTTVTQGTLELTSPNTNNQSSTIIIASGAQLRLSFTGTDTVDKLFIGPTQMPPGIYKATASAATGTALSQLGGTGTLTVTTGPGASYAAWQLVQGITGAINADHDKDGVANGIEYFLHGLGGNPTGYTPLPAVINNAGTLRITWTMSAGYGGTYGTDFTVETTGNLGAAWTTETLGGNVSIVGSEVRYTFPPGTEKFARLKIIHP